MYLQEAKNIENNSISIIKQVDIQTANSYWPLKNTIVLNVLITITTSKNKLRCFI